MFDAWKAGRGEWVDSIPYLPLPVAAIVRGCWGENKHFVDFSRHSGAPVLTEPILDALRRELRRSAAGSTILLTGSRPSVTRQCSTPDDRRGIMTRTEVTYGQLDKVLLSLGFSCRLVKGDPPARVYEHKETGASFMLSPSP